MRALLPAYVSIVLFSGSALACLGTIGYPFKRIFRTILKFSNPNNASTPNLGTTLFKCVVPLVGSPDLSFATLGRLDLSDVHIILFR